jgi:hypothetical protein
MSKPLSRRSRGLFAGIPHNRENRAAKTPEDEKGTRRRCALVPAGTRFISRPRPSSDESPEYGLSPSGLRWSGTENFCQRLDSCTTYKHWQTSIMKARLPRRWPERDTIAERSVSRAGICVVVSVFRIGKTRCRVPQTNRVVRNEANSSRPGQDRVPNRRKMQNKPNLPPATPALALPTVQNEPNLSGRARAPQGEMCKTNPISPCGTRAKCAKRTQFLPPGRQSRPIIPAFQSDGDCVKRSQTRAGWSIRRDGAWGASCAKQSQFAAAGKRGQVLYV